MQRLYKFILLFLILCMMQKPELIFIPHSNNTFFGAIGLLCYLFGHDDRRRILSHITIRGNDFVRIVFPFVLVAVVAIVVNFSFDMRYVKYVVPLFFAFWASYLIAVVSYRAYGRFDIKIFMKYLLLAELIYLGISVLMFFSPSISALMTSLQKMDAIMMAAYERTSELRIVGFGANFFTSGILNGYILILLAFYIISNKFTYKKLMLLYLLYVIITVVGMMMARTALVGSGIGLAIIGLHLAKDPKALLRTIMLIILCIVAILFVLAKFFSDFAAQLQVLFSFAFEMFFNLSDSGSLSTGSTDTLMTMWDIIPKTFKSWVIGDARWDTATGYYKGTDVGYLRNIWYFGIVGMACLTYYYYKTLKIIFIERNPGFEKSRILGLILFAYVMILNVKGPADLFFYVIPLYFCSPAEEDPESAPADDSEEKKEVLTAI